MISISIPASMTCDEPNCPAAVPVGLYLLGSGGFSFKPGTENKNWQVMLPKGPEGLGAPFQALCPEHRTRLQVGPAGRRVVLANEH